MSNTRSLGTLYLVPNALDAGTGFAGPSLEEVLALGVIRLAARLEYWVVENAKSTRQFLKRVEATTPLARPLQQLSIVQLPVPDKGRKVLGTAADLDVLLAPALSGNDIGLLSEAGLPAVADPGAVLVQRAHARDIRVTALAGPSALLLALAASGLNGQGFEFVGYLPIEAQARSARLRELEAQSRRDGATRIMIETPYRNQALLDAMLQHLHSSTLLSVSCGLTLPSGFSRTASVADWRASPWPLPSDVPTVFLLLSATHG